MGRLSGYLEEREGSSDFPALDVPLTGTVLQCTVPALGDQVHHMREEGLAVSTRSLLNSCRAGKLLLVCWLEDYL